MKELVIVRLGAQLIVESSSGAKLAVKVSKALPICLQPSVAVKETTTAYILGHTLQENAAQLVLEFVSWSERQTYGVRLGGRVTSGRSVSVARQAVFCVSEGQ